eukprot:TRINITY_DN41263_c0_g1_i1.p1 TRINITY_DN41263_c0_g1~~TRINITY_DN41263_c0_g1_i1.p1  ORF type:complete len:490 (+),score=67.66 TRINITY_DN41263_c0_g1_i1:213-1472(+)
MSLQYCRDHSSSALSRFLRKITIDMSYSFRHWRRHQRATRHLLLWTPRRIITSDNIRRLLFPDLAFIGTTSSLLCYYNMLHPEALLTVPVECFTLTSVALGLLATFKTQTGYSRFNEGRSLWGLMINESRALASRILVRVPSVHGQGGPEVIEAKRKALKLVRTFPIVLKYHLTEDGCNPHIVIRHSSTETEIRAATTAALRTELHALWNPSDPRQQAFVNHLVAPEIGNRPLYVLHELQHVNASVFAAPSLGALDGPAATEMDRSLTTLHNVLGACEKILRTPIYTPYTRFTSRFLHMWCNALPLAMFPLAGPVMTVPITLVTSFFMLGIEDIGSRVEQPFNVLPLWQYCQTVEQSCLQLIRHHEQLEQDMLDAFHEEEEFQWDLGSLGSYVDPLSEDVMEPRTVPPVASGTQRDHET